MKYTDEQKKRIRHTFDYYGGYIGYFVKDNYVFSEEIKATLMKAVLKFNIDR